MKWSHANEKGFGAENEMQVQDFTCKAVSIGINNGAPGCSCPAILLACVTAQHARNPARCTDSSCAHRPTVNTTHHESRAIIWTAYMKAFARAPLDPAPPSACVNQTAQPV